MIKKRYVRKLLAWCPEKTLRRQFGVGLGVSRRRLVVFAAASVMAATFLIWALQPYLTPPVYHAVNITIEYRNMLYFGVRTGKVNIRSLVPIVIELPLEETLQVMFRMGLCRVSAGKRVYESLLVMVSTDLCRSHSPRVGPVGSNTEAFAYVLGFFGNNSELGDFFQSYGFPYTYVQAAYSYVSEGSKNQTLLSMTYPNGSHLLEMSTITHNYTDPYILWEHYGAFYYLRGSYNLTILHHRPVIRSIDRERVPYTQT